MTARRSAFVGLVGVVFAFWIAAIGCALDPYGYGDSADVCTLDIHCDDDEPCTEDACGADGICMHQPVENGDYPDGVSGNCQILKCEGGVSTPVDSGEDVDDGNECTEDACSASGATHTVIEGAACHVLKALGSCDAEGECIVECGQIDADGNEVTCDPAPNECTLSYCDKAQGK